MLPFPFPHPAFAVGALPDLVSFDVFDTLLLRRVETPAAVFDAVARRARAAGLVDEGLTSPLFRLARQEAERQARQAAGDRGGEVELAAIYRHAALGDADALAALELEVEAETLFANPLLLHALRALAERGCPVVLLSDMYLPPDALRGLLRGAGISDRLYRSLYVSCVEGCSKRDGGLFRKLLADHPHLRPERILHIGDDAIGDVTMAQAAGLHTVHYVPPPDFARLQERERTLAGLAAGALLPPVRRLTALAGLGDAPDEAFWLAFGTLVLGPAVVGYCHWVVEDCRRRGIGVIAPLMREAHLFAPLMKDWIRQQGYAIRVAPLFVSRQALAPLDFAGMDGERARKILSGRPNLAWDKLLNEVGGAVSPELAPVAGLTLERLAGQSLPDGRPALEAALALFNAPERRRRAEELAEETRALAGEHLAERLGRAERVALVDLGARASIPAALVSLIPDGRRRFHTYLCYAVADVAKRLAMGMSVSVFCGGSDVALIFGRILYRTPQILERALTGLSGTTLGYRRDAQGRCIPHTAPPPARGEEARAVALLQAGIRRYADLLRATQTAEALPETGPALPAPGLPDGEASLFPLVAALLMPTEEEARRLGSLRYDYNDGTDLERGICDKVALSEVAPLAEAAAPPLMSLAMGLRPLSVPWPQGALTLRDSGLFRRPAEAMALEVGHGAVCRALAAEALRRGFRRVAAVAVGGEGGMGPDFVRVAGESGLELAAYADLMPHLILTPRFHGVPVLPLERLPELDDVPLVLVTLGYADRLEALARAHFAAAGRLLQLVALGKS
ncbi:haloacid dehalogenase-like hydrolase [Azospirillum brasilense]|nr:haloacid dehalogenase-like hydrolase [Azospirillum brasilense]